MVDRAKISREEADVKAEKRQQETATDIFMKLVTKAEKATKIKKTPYVIVLDWHEKLQ